jgi:hypothetical protein
MINRGPYKRVYLALPYTHRDYEIRNRRFEEVNRLAARVMMEGYTIFSPISQSHPISTYLPDCTETWDFWQKQDLPWLERCDEVWVLMLDKWNESVGVRGEIKHAKACGIPIFHIRPEDWNLDPIKVDDKGF